MYWEPVTGETKEDWYTCTVDKCQDIVDVCVKDETLCNELYFEYSECIYALNTTECLQCAWSFEIAGYPTLRTDYCNQCFNDCGGDATRARIDSVVFDHYFEC